jgi:nitric oxide reductase activation protein
MSLDEAVEALHDKIREASGGADKERRHPDSVTKILDVEHIRKARYYTTRSGADLERRVRQATSRLRDGFRSLLIGRSKRKMKRHQDSGVLDTTRLADHMSTGTNAVWNRRGSKQDTAATVSVLLDLSGSMCDSEKDFRAQEAVMSLALSLEGLVDYEVLGYSGGGGGPGDYRVPDYAITDDLYIFPIKTFDQRLDTNAKDRIANAIAYRENPDSEAIDFATSRLQARSGGGGPRLFFHLSDGEPSCGGDRSIQMHYTQEAVKAAVAKGIKCFGVGMLDDAVSRVYSNYVVVSDMRTLSKDLISLVRKAV